MTLLTKQEIEALLDGTAPGLVDHCLYHCGKRLAECPCMRDLAAKGALTDAAPNLARTALDALAVEEHLDRPRVKHHMGQIIAECDCPHPDKCNRADRCTATRTKD